MIEMIGVRATMMKIASSGNLATAVSHSDLHPSGSAAAMVRKETMSGATITAPGSMITANSSMGAIRAPKVGIWAGEDMARADIPKADPNTDNAMNVSTAGRVAMRAASITEVHIGRDMIPWVAVPE